MLLDIPDQNVPDGETPPDSYMAQLFISDTNATIARVGPCIDTPDSGNCGYKDRTNRGDRSTAYIAVPLSELPSVNESSSVVPPPFPSPTDAWFVETQEVRIADIHALIPSWADHERALSTESPASWHLACVCTCSGPA